MTGDWDTIDLMRPDVIPLINFGLIGTNLFECFDCAYCLTGFYVNAEIVDTILQDVLASDGHLPIAIPTEGSPRRRHARVADPRRASTTWTDWPNSPSTSKRWTSCSRPSAASGPTRGRVRSSLFQCAGHPQLDYDREFGRIAEAREFFALPTRRERERDRNADRVRAARQAGKTQRAAAAALQLGRSTIQRYWNRAEGPTNPSKKKRALLPTSG